MRILITAWEGFSLQDADFEALIPIGGGNVMAAAQPTYIDLGEKDPILAGKTLTGTSFTFHVRLKGETDADLEAQRDLLNAEFLPNQFTKQRLFGEDVDNGNKEWYLLGYPITAPVLKEGALKNLFSITLALDVPYWLSSDENTNTWSITADTETQTMTNDGNIAALPVFHLTPVLAKGSNSAVEKIYCAVHTDGWGSRMPVAVNLTENALDTAALILAGRMQADGSDVRVIANGYNSNYWFGGGGINSATTGIISHLSFTNFPSMTLISLNGNSPRGESAVTCTISINPNMVILGRVQVPLPQQSTIQIDNELIAYSGAGVVADANGTYTAYFVKQQRGAKGSTQTTHTLGSSIFVIENDVWITFGDPSAAAPVVDDALKPVIDLATFDNETITWSNNFGNTLSALNPRTMTPARFGVGTHYTSVNNADGFVTPFDVIGLKLSSIASGTGIISDVTSKPTWVFSHPGGIEHVDATGEKFRSGATFGTLTVEDGTNVFATIASPSAANTWEPISLSTACATNPNSITIAFTGGLGTTAPTPYAQAELSEVTLTVHAPVSILRIAEQVNYQLSGYLKNDTNGQVIHILNIPTMTGETIVIDCENQEVSGEDGKSLRAMIAFGGDKRDEWMELEPGANDIIFYDAGTSSLSNVTDWRERNTL